jgi:hypothetical protein
LPFAASMLNRISAFCSDSSQRPSIFPTNPHWFFFLKIATSTASSASARSFSSRSCFRASYCSAVTVFFLPPVERPTAQGHLASPVSEYGLNRRHKALHDVKSQLPVYLSSGLQEIFETFSLVIKTVVSFFSFESALMVYSFAADRPSANSGRLACSLRCCWLSHHTM